MNLACVRSLIQPEDEGYFTMQNNSMNVATFDWRQNDLEGGCDNQGGCYALNPPDPGVIGMPKPYFFEVIDTDYINYAINYHCDADTGYPQVWILSRKQDLSQAEYDQIYARMTQLLPNFDHNLYMQDRFNHQGCVYDN